MSVATGFTFEPVPDGNVLIEFFADDGKTINKQIVTFDLIRRIPVVAGLNVAVKEGPEAAKEVMGIMNRLNRMVDVGR